MIKKVANWTLGSFFRTAGRLLFYIVVGIIIASFIKSGDFNINLSDLFTFGFEKVDALTLDGKYRGGYNIFNGVSWEKEFANCVNCPTPSNTLSNTWTFNNNWTQQYDNWYMIFTLAAYSQRIEQSKISNDWFTDVELERTILAIELGTVNDTWTLCELQNNLIVCPLLKGKEYSKLRITANMPNSQTQGFLSYNSWTISLFSLVNLYEKDSATSAIESQTQQQQQQQNETMTFFNNENTTQAESSANNFFSGFTTQDNGGISSIITAPLNAISGLVNSTCSPIVLPIPYLGNETLTLPCMSSIYTQHFGSFFIIYQTIIFGAVAYRMLVSIFMIIEGLKNPDDDKIEVVDL